MLLWVDAQLSPAIAPWLSGRFGVEAFSVKFLGLRDATDQAIFAAARAAGAIVLTKDRDFLRLLEVHGPPPSVILLTIGNTSNAKLKTVLLALFVEACQLIEGGDPLVEIGDQF